MWLWSRTPKSAKSVILQPRSQPRLPPPPEPVQEEILSSSTDSESPSSSSSSNHHPPTSMPMPMPMPMPIELDDQPDQEVGHSFQNTTHLTTPALPRVAATTTTTTTTALNVDHQPSNLILNHHPNLNFLNLNTTSTTTPAINTTPIPSFPRFTTLATSSPSLKTLEQTRRQSELNFFRHIYHHNPSTPSNQPHQQPSSDHRSPSTQPQPFSLRLVDQPQADQSSSVLLLPYPNPDLSLMTDQSTPIESNQQPSQASKDPDLHHASSPSIHQRPISALPSRTQTPFKPFKPQPSSSLRFNRTRSPLSSLDQPDRCPTIARTPRTTIAADDPTPHQPIDSTPSKQQVDSLTQPIDSPTHRFDLRASQIDSPSERIHPPIEQINYPCNLILSPTNAQHSPSKLTGSPIKSNESPTKPLDSPTKPINPPTKPFRSPSDDCVEATSPPPSSPTRLLTSPKPSTESFEKLIDPPRAPSKSPRKSVGVPPRCHGSPKKSGGPKTSVNSPREPVHSPTRAHRSPIKSRVSPLKFNDSSNEANASPRKPGFRPASAVISSVIKPAENVPQVSSSTMAQVMNELESRTKDAPRITKITFQDQINLPPNHARSQSNPASNRFTDAHGKEFAKYDSITNHYAAKRKIEESGNGQSAANPVMKRAKVSNLGLPKPVDHQPAENATDSKEAQKKRQNVKRQLELARSRRKSNTSKQTKPAPSGFSSFGSRLLRSAVKTVTGAFKGTQQVTNKTDGVGFGVPAGLGVGPAKAPPSPIRKDVQPTRSIVKPPLTRLPPAGLHRITSSTLVGATNRRRVVSGPPVASSNSLSSNKNSSLANQPQTQGHGPAKSVAVSKSTWQPKTLPKPTVPITGSMTSARPKTSLNNPATSATSSTIMKSRIPKVSTYGGQTVIRATVKTITEGTARSLPNCPPSVPPLPAFNKSSKIAVGIGQSNKVLPTKLSQPIRSTKPLKTTVRSTSMTAASRESQRKPFGSSSFAGGKAKSSISSNSILKEKGKRLSISNRSKFVGMQKKRKSSFGRSTRRRSSLSVGTKALSHRVS